jgi:NADP-dependent aldehyde dehydrogenase
MLSKGIAASVRRGLDALVQAGASIVESAPARGGGWSAPAAVLTAPIMALHAGSPLLEECFGAVAVVVEYGDQEQVLSALGVLQGSLAGTVFAADGTDPDAEAVTQSLSRTVGRVMVNDWRPLEWPPLGPSTTEVPGPPPRTPA